MKHSRALYLRRETLTQLSGDDLRDVLGAAAALPTMPVKACPQLENTNVYCFTRGSTCDYCEGAR